MLLQQQSAIDSCFARGAYPLMATCHTGSGGRVDWILCSDCEAVCDRMPKNVGQAECPFVPCGYPERRGESKPCQDS
jgi:hypothetical protein